MKFRLVYRGALPPANGSTTTDKHEIRKKFHRQINSFTNSDKVPDLVRNAPPTKRSSYNFVPIIGKKNYCSLDILFLRSDIPGSPGFAGDIDNRVKTLLDALTMPSKQQIPSNASPEQHEDPFFCLLEDDNLVSHLSVEMDQLLDLQGSSKIIPSEALLIITVNLEPGLLVGGSTLIL